MITFLLIHSLFGLGGAEEGPEHKAAVTIKWLGGRVSCGVACRTVAESEKFVGVMFPGRHEVQVQL